MFVTKCGAKSRTNSHKPCRQPAMSNGRCRLHGGKSTGPRTGEGKEQVREVNTKHGMYSVETIQGRKEVGELIQRSREVLRTFK